MSNTLSLTFRSCVQGRHKSDLYCIAKLARLRDARLVQAARLWHYSCTPALVCSLGPRLEQLQFSRLGLLAGGGVALKGTELLK